jgi:hypothetical protein
MAGKKPSTIKTAGRLTSQTGIFPGWEMRALTDFLLGMGLD